MKIGSRERATIRIRRHPIRPTRDPRIVGSGMEGDGSTAHARAGRLAPGDISGRSTSHQENIQSRLHIIQSRLSYGLLGSAAGAIGVILALTGLARF